MKKTKTKNNYTITDADIRKIICELREEADIRDAKITAENERLLSSAESLVSRLEKHQADGDEWKE